MTVSISQGMRNAVYSLTDINDAIATSNKRLATGKKVNSALDNAGAFFRANGLNKDARDLGGLLDGMERGGKIIAKAASAINGMIKLAESAQALARQAGQLTAGSAGRGTLQSQALGLMQQMQGLAVDAGYDGKNILTVGNVAATSESIATNVSGSTSIVLSAQNARIGQASGIDTGQAITTAGFTSTAAAVDTLALAATNWLDVPTGSTLITNAVNSFSAQITNLTTIASSIATQAAVVDIRKGFTKDAMRANNEFADYLTLADMNEEGAALTALQTKQSLAVTSLSLAGRADQAILRLF